MQPIEYGLQNMTHIGSYFQASHRCKVHWWFLPEYRHWRTVSHSSRLRTAFAGQNYEPLLWRFLKKSEFKIGYFCGMGIMWWRGGFAPSASIECHQSVFVGRVAFQRKVSLSEEIPSGFEHAVKHRACHRETCNAASGFFIICPFPLWIVTKLLRQSEYFSAEIRGGCNSALFSSSSVFFVS